MVTATDTLGVIYDCPKKQHDNRAGAVMQARRMWARGHRPLGGLRIYRCHFCGCWHIGNKLRRRNRGRR